MSNFEIKSIGEVKADDQGTYLQIHEEYRAALTGLEGFSFIQVLWWAHHCDDQANRREVTVEKPYKNAPDVLGLFATRSPARPNPLGLTPVAVFDVDINTGIIRIPFIDADTGSPVVDIKPYQSCIDRIKEVSYPNWCSHWPQWYEDSAHFNWEEEFTFSV